MHRAATEAAHQTDSMKMFLMGVDGGKPADGGIGVQPEWFYKGDGAALIAPGAPLPSPDFALDAGEEPEIAGRSEEHTSELQSLMRISYAVFCLKKKTH